MIATSSQRSDVFNMCLYLTEKYRGYIDVINLRIYVEYDWISMCDGFEKGKNAIVSLINCEKRERKKKGNISLDEIDF